MNLIMWLMPYGGDRMVGGTKWARRDEDATVGGEAGDSVRRAARPPMTRRHHRRPRAGRAPHQSPDGHGR